jgi:hypothetical protein
MEETFFVVHFTTLSAYLTSYRRMIGWLLAEYKSRALPLHQPAQFCCQMSGLCHNGLSFTSETPCCVCWLPCSYPSVAIYSTDVGRKLRSVSLLLHIIAGHISNMTLKASPSGWECYSVEIPAELIEVKGETLPSETHNLVNSVFDKKELPQ